MRVGIVRRFPGDLASLELAAARHDPLTNEWTWPSTCDGCGYRSDFLVAMGIGGYRCPSCRREARKHAPEVERRGRA